MAPAIAGVHVSSIPESWRPMTPSSRASEEPSSVPYQIASPSLRNPNQSDPSTDPNQRIVSNRYIALRPWYAASHQSGLDETLRSNSEAKTPRSRKGHTKSRQGCFECKKRKIKVFSSSNSTCHAQGYLVSRKSSGMYQLRAERTPVQISSHKNTAKLAVLGRCQSLPFPYSTPDNASLQHGRYAIVSLLHFQCLPTSPSW
jgi:hypothetical protein